MVNQVKLKENCAVVFFVSCLLIFMTTFQQRFNEEKIENGNARSTQRKGIPESVFHVQPVYDCCTTCNTHFYAATECDGNVNRTPYLRWYRYTVQGQHRLVLLVPVGIRQTPNAKRRQHLPCPDLPLSPQHFSKIEKSGPIVCCYNLRTTSFCRFLFFTAK